jgi:thiol-disulfide isomerase/thioredoxin
MYLLKKGVFMLHIQKVRTAIILTLCMLSLPSIIADGCRSCTTCPSSKKKATPVQKKEVKTEKKVVTPVKKEDDFIEIDDMEEIEIVPVIQKPSSIKETPKPAQPAKNDHGNGVRKITSGKEFNDLKNSSKLVVIKFFATWCGPCQLYAPTFDQVAQKHGDKAIFAMIDADATDSELQKIGAKHAQYLPTTLFMKNGTVLESITGQKSAGELERLINKHK